MCDVTDIQSNRGWWLGILDQRADYTVFRLSKFVTISFGKACRTRAHVEQQRHLAIIVREPSQETTAILDKTLVVVLSTSPQTASRIKETRIQHDSSSHAFFTCLRRLTQELSGPLLPPLFRPGLPFQFRSQFIFVVNVLPSGCSSRVHSRRHVLATRPEAVVLVHLPLAQEVIHTKLPK